MSKTKRIFDIVLARYGNPDYQPPKALIERPNTVVFPALQEAPDNSFNMGAVQAYSQQPLLEAPMMDGMGGMGGDPMGISAQSGNTMQQPALFPEADGEEYLP